MPRMAEHSEVGQPTPHVPPLVVGIRLTPLIEFALNAEYPDFVCPKIHVHGSLLRLYNPIVFLLPFALYAAFPHSDYYESSALGVVPIWPSQRARLPTGQTIQVPVFRFPTLVPLGGELYPVQCGRWGKGASPISGLFENPAVRIDEPYRL